MDKSGFSGPAAPVTPATLLRLGPASGLVAEWHPARRPLPGGARALLLWLHGGGFTAGSARDARPRAAGLAEAGADVVALDYPLAPAHPFPAALTAAFDAWQDLAARRAELTGSPSTALFVGGEEAGGNLAAALTLMARDQQAPQPAGQLLLLPMLDPQLASASMREGECGGCECRYAQGWRAYLGASARADHPYAAPLGARRLADLPPALVLGVSGHALNDDGRRYAAALRQHGGSARELVVPDVTAVTALAAVHDFLAQAAGRALPAAG